MQIEAVSFERNPGWVTENPNQWVGKVKFSEGSGTKCEFPLAPEIATRLLTVLTPVLVEFSQRATNQIGEILTKQLEASSTPAIDLPKE